jgi:RNA polymerase sigma-70 factor, ECF subfamily
MDRLTHLAEEAGSGSSAAMEEFVSLGYNDVRRLCASLVDEPSANDLAQETFLRVVRQFSRFRGESSARTWMLSIAHHVCMDELRVRVRARRPSIAAPSGRISPDHSESVCAIDLLAGLEPERRAAFSLTQLFGLSYAEVAAMLGCAPGTVASRVSRARSDLILMMGVNQTQDQREA